MLKQGLTVIFFQLNTHHHEGGVVFNLLVSLTASSLIQRGSVFEVVVPHTEDVRDNMSCVSVSTEQTSASLTLNNGTATIVVSPCNFGDGAVVTATGLGRSVLGANNQSTAPGQFVLELLVGSRGVAVRGRSEPTVTPDYKGVARRETAKKIRAEFFDCTLLLGVTLELPSSGTTGLHSSLQGRGGGNPRSYVALVVWGVLEELLAKTSIAGCRFRRLWSLISRSRLCNRPHSNCHCLFDRPKTDLFVDRLKHKFSGVGRRSWLQQTDAVRGNMNSHSVDQVDVTRVHSDDVD